MEFNIPTDEKNIAIAVSGGGDSMALAHMMCAWAVEDDRQVHILTVNHNLRPDAMEEAEKVAQWIENYPNSIHQILTWQHDDMPDTAVMERARLARYDLMAEYCRDNDIKTLCVAHHGDDQLETFMFRLAKGSGLDGLKGMTEWSDYDENLKIYRPLLGQSHQNLIDYCVENNIKWIEDPSNKNEKYARPRLRKALENEGFDVSRFAKTLKRLSRAQEALDWMVDDFLSHHENLNVINFEKLKSYPIDIQIRVLQKVISETGEVTHNYPPKLERIEDIIATLMPNKSATLHGCVLTLSKDGNTLEIKGA